MDDTATSVGAGAAITAAGLWLVSRLLNKPDEQAKEIAALRERVIRLEARIGSEGDVGTMMHVLTTIQQQIEAMQRAVNELTRRPS
jgi:hypothetical protein